GIRDVHVTGVQTCALPIFARNCISRLGFEDCVIYLVDEEKKLLKQKAAYGPKNSRAFEIVNPISIPFGKGIVGDVAQSGKPSVIDRKSTRLNSSHVKISYA